MISTLQPQLLPIPYLMTVTMCGTYSTSVQPHFRDSTNQIPSLGPCKLIFLPLTYQISYLMDFASIGLPPSTSDMFDSDTDSDYVDEDDEDSNGEHPVPLRSRFVNLF